MRHLGARLLFPFLIVPTLAQEPQQVLPDSGAPPEIDTITPVPLPEIPFGGGELAQPTLPEELKITNQGGSLSGSVETGVRFGGPVKIEGDTGLEIFSNTALLDLKEKKVILEGDVSVYQGNLLQRGERAVYYYETKKVDTSGLRASVDPFLIESGKFRNEEHRGKTILIGEDAAVTTHDVEHPNFWIKASKTVIYPGDRVTFTNLRLYANDTPVFWFPYLSQPLDSDLGYHFMPGAKSNWGPYLLNSYGVMLGGERDPLTGDRNDPWLLSKWRFDILTRRGVGVGVDLQDKRKPEEAQFDGLGVYYLYDFDQNLRRSGIPRDPINPDRYELNLQHRLELDFPDDGLWRLDTNLTYLSDRYYLEDFDPSVYRKDPFPDNTIGLFRRDDKTLLSLFGRFRFNDFYRTDTRLPEIALDQARGPFFGTALLHEGNTSFGVYEEKIADPTRENIVDPLLSLPPGPTRQRLLNRLQGYERALAQQILSLPPGDPRRDELETQLINPGFTRFHTLQEFSLPLNLGGFLSLTPEFGGGYTRYESVRGPMDAFDHQFVYTGAEASVKFTKDYGSSAGNGLGLDGLMHVLQPYAKWSVVMSDGSDDTDPKIDRLTASTRPRPQDPNRFTAIDDMESWNIMRLGMRNRILTRRDNQSYDWLFVDTYIDHFYEDPEADREFSNLYNDITWQPLPWMSVDLQTQFPIVSGGSDFREFYARTRFQPTPETEFSIGYRFLNDHPTLLDSNRIDFRIYTRLNEHWGLGMRHILEMDDGTLEQQQYSVHRDFGNWVAGIGLVLRDNRVKDEYGVLFSLTLKDFPSVSLPFELDAN